jgi:hypothetical protein
MHCSSAGKLKAIASFCVVFTSVTVCVAKQHLLYVRHVIMSLELVLLFQSCNYFPSLYDFL